MFDLGKHAVFIWWSYGIVTVVLAGLIVWLIWDWRRRQSQISALEARGVRRRSQNSTKTAVD